jgi:hypothetical protein
MNILNWSFHMILRRAMATRLVLCVVLFVAVLALAGCHSVPISTQWKLRNFNLATADISQLRVAVHPPVWAAPTPERTILTARLEFNDGSPEKKLDIHLRRGAHAEDRGALAQVAAEPESLVVYETGPGDLRAIRAFQSESQSAKEAGRNGQGHIELNGNLACRLSNVPEGPILVDAYIHASDEIGWMPLIAAYDLTAGMRPEDISDARVPSCATQATRAAR